MVVGRCFRLFRSLRQCVCLSYIKKTSFHQTVVNGEFAVERERRERGRHFWKDELDPEKK